MKRVNIYRLPLTHKAIALMRKITIWILLLATSQMYAQHWGENNPVWHYEQRQYMPSADYGYHWMSVVGDTIIEGDTARILRHEYRSPLETNYYTYFMRSVNQKVYQYIDELAEFKLLYDFTAETGDTVKIWANDITINILDSLDIIIDSTSTILLNGTSLKVQYFRTVNYWGAYEFRGRIIEGIGWDGYMFPLCSFVDPPFGGKLRCFEDGVIGLYKFSLLECDYVGINEEMASSYTIYPNPVIETLHITANEIPEVCVYSLTGQLLTTCHAAEIDFQHFPSGLYFITISFSSSIIVEKVMKL